MIFHTNGSSVTELKWLRSVVPKHLDVSFEEVAVGFPRAMRDFPGGRLDMACLLNTPTYYEVYQVHRYT